MKQQPRIYSCKCGESTIEAIQIIGGTCIYCETALLPVPVEKLRTVKGQTRRELARTYAIATVTEREAA